MSSLPAPARAAATIAKPPADPSVASAPAADPSALAKIVSRLSAAEQRSGRDWAELARETAIWGSQLKTGQQPVPEGPVRDALTAVDLGSKLDPKTADWPKLRAELEALLEQPEPPPEQPEQNQQQQNQDQQKQEQEKQQEQQAPQDKSSSNPQNGQQQPKPNDQEQKQSDDQNAKAEPKPPGESAFGDMQQKQEPPPPPPGDTQKVGGPQEDEQQPINPPDPALALPLQKLDQLREQDSPAQLFQLMEGDRQPTKKTGKDW